MIDQLSKEFVVQVLGDLSYFLSIQVKRTKEGLFLGQQQYTSKLLKSAGFDNLRPASTPMIVKQNLSSKEEPISQAKEYRRIIGSLQYLTLTRPDI